MTPATSGNRPLRWWMIPVRVILFTFLCTLLGFAVTLLLGIVGVLVAAKIQNIPPVLSVAYRGVAPVGGAVVGGIVLVSSLVMEVRYYRRAKALAAIERASQ